MAMLRLLRLVAGAAAVAATALAQPQQELNSSKAPCHGCGHACDANCNCGVCNTHGCASEQLCMGACNSGHNAKWCGGTGPSPPPPAPPPRAAWATQRDVPRLWAQLRRELQLRNLHHDEVRQCWLVPRAVQQREECEVVRRGAGPTASAWSPRAASKQWHLPGLWVRVRCELQLREMQYEARL